jgi:predicted RND superfamily exporter protein
MKLLIFVLRSIAGLSMKRPLMVISAFALLSVAGFASMPFIVVSTNLMAGVGEANAVINLTRENTEQFGEQDSLIVVLQFPQPPGESRLPFIRGLADSIGQISGIRRVRYRLLDADDPKEVDRFFKHFLLGMNQREGEGIQKIFSPKGVEDALRRSRNRLFLADNPYIQQKILEDPLELGQFVSHCMERRIGTISLGDLYLLISGPDSTLFLIQVTPEFPSSNIAKAKELVEKVREVIPKKVTELNDKFKLVGNPKDLTWHLTGKTAFQCESDEIFDQETSTLLLISFALVALIFLSIYRSFVSSTILMIPLLAGIGPNYGFLYLAYDDVNPVVMGATGVLLGLGAEYGVHLWGRFREEYDGNVGLEEAVFRAYEHTGPPVMLGALTGIIAFLCLCLSSQHALVQFGYFGAVGLALTMISTLFLFPAMVRILSRLKKDRYPRMRVSFSGFAKAFEYRPVFVVTVSIALIGVSAIFASKVTYEKDLFRVFLARDMDSMAVSQKISRNFHSNFTQPTLLSFDADDIQTGLVYQRKLDELIEGLMAKDHEIASFDSISYLLAPDGIREENATILAGIAQKWPTLEALFRDNLAWSDLTEQATGVMTESFDSIGKILVDLGDGKFDKDDNEAALERSWYVAKIRGKYRFLTQVRYSDKITEVDKLKRADRKISEAAKSLPMELHISGTRQTMEAILSSLVSELFKLGLYAFLSLTIIFFIVFPSPLGVGLCLIPMIGSFSITLGTMAFLGMGLPFSIVCVAPLVFGFSIHNGIHVVMGSLHEKGSTVEKTMARVTPRAVLTSLTIMAGFVAMITARHYSMEFLGWAMVVGMLSAVPLTLVTLPALLFIIERKRRSGALEHDSQKDPQTDSQTK